jgi:hypothetical protein
VIRLQRSAVDEATRTVRETVNGDAVVAFAFADGTFEAYGADAHVLSVSALERTTDSYSDGWIATAFRTDRDTGERRARELSAAGIPVIVVNGDDLHAATE